jgi:carboxylesterase
MSSGVLPGVDSFTFEGGPTGVLLLHGFTGNPSSLRPLGEWLAARGHAVSCPRYPGHGTTWQELASTRWQHWESSALAALEELKPRCEDVVACGLSVGGAMALHLGVRASNLLRGVVAINPYLRNWRMAFAPFVRPFHPSVRGVGDDIKKPGSTEVPYERIPVVALIQLNKFLSVVRAELPLMRLPLVVFRSAEDHVVPKGNADILLRKVGSAEKHLVALPNSYHVATMDYDAERMFERIHQFITAKATTRS